MIRKDGKLDQRTKKYRRHAERQASFYRQVTAVLIITGLLAYTVSSAVNHFETRAEIKKQEFESNLIRPVLWVGEDLDPRMEVHDNYYTSKGYKSIVVQGDHPYTLFYAPEAPQSTLVGFWNNTGSFMGEEDLRAYEALQRLEFVLGDTSVPPTPPTRGNSDDLN